VRELGLGRVLRSTPSNDRVFFHAVWFRGHNNQRYAALLPRLDRVDAYLLTCSDQRVLRGVQFRAYRRTERVRNRWLLRHLSSRYRSLFAVDVSQVQYFDGPVVVDVDDPKFTPREAELLGGDNVVVYVVTDERAAQRYEQLGLSKPYEVIPQGVDLDAVTPEGIARARARIRRPGDIIVGYVAAWLFSGDDRHGGNPLYNVDHLVQVLWPAIRARVPDARLVLVGEPSARVRRLCAGRSDVELLGRLPQHEVLNHVAAFDLALYPRRVEHTVRTIKIAEYLGLGVPTVSYDLEIAHDVEASGGGLLAGTPSEFVAAVATLASSPERRQAMGAAAREYASGWRWNTLGDQYRELLDRYLPR
jgi:glycosyltransferase involved in cell wall biosynthesis